MIFRWYWETIWRKVATASLPELPDPKPFSPKFDLPFLDCYKTAAGPAFWEKFPVNLNKNARSLVNGSKLRKLATAYGFPNKQLLNTICCDLSLGATIGCYGNFRDPGSASNAPSAYENGAKVTDAIAGWCTKGFVFGPVEKSEVPKTAKFNGIMTRPKSTGGVRIILNLSAPKGSSVNDGIDSAKFPASMSSTTKWLMAVNTAGKGGKMCKCDWAEAYKHIHVASSDSDLQWFEWLGKCFKEVCLVFGCASSAGIYDRLAKVVLFIVLRKSKFPEDQVIQHLDDVCAAAQKDSTHLEVFDAVFSEVAASLGVRLAPRDDPEKSFGPSSAGIVLGVFYDLEEWVWAIPQGKLIRIMHTLKEVMEAESCKQDLLWSLVGKLLHVAPLVPGGRFHLFHVLQANSFSDDPSTLVPLSADLKQQLWFWFTMLQVCSNRASIPNPRLGLPAWALDVYTDAAGGSWRSKGQGVGAVGRDWWVVLPWSAAINAGRPTGDGRRLDRVMSALELVGPLLGLCAAAEHCRNFCARFWVDNAGSVFIFKKGYSTSCALSSTIAAAMAEVAAGIGCRVELCKITRCSTPQADMADALSKGAFPRFWELARSCEDVDLPLEPLQAPLELVKWLEAPKPDFGLGTRLLKELAGRGPVLGF